MTEVDATFGAQFDPPLPDEEDTVPHHLLQPTGDPGQDDLAVDATASLVVSDRALEVLRRFHLEHCDRTDWSPRAEDRRPRARPRRHHRPAAPSLLTRRGHVRHVAAPTGSQRIVTTLLWSVP